MGVAMVTVPSLQDVLWELSIEFREPEAGMSNHMVCVYRKC